MRIVGGCFSLRARMDRSPKAKADSDTPNAPREAPIFVDGVAYDVAAWARKHHPGGEIVMRFLGLDATTSWRERRLLG